MTSVTRSRSRWMAPLAGATAAALALAVTELIAGLVGAGSSLIESVADAVIDLSPQAVVGWAIDVFGTADKPVLIGGIIVLSLVFGAFLAHLAVRRPAAGVAGFVAVGMVGVVAGSRDPLASTELAAVMATAGAGAGIWALRAMITRLETAHAPAADLATPATATGVGRRAFLTALGATALVGAAAAALGRSLLQQTRVIAAGRADVVLPAPSSPAASPVAASSLEVPGITPLITPNDDFYRIDTAISVPIVDLESWRLRITGLVARPYELTYDELLRFPMVERHLTMACVSNDVGGRLVGTARWLGVPLRDLLDRARVEGEASQVVGRSVDGFTAGFPYSLLDDEREALVAVGMNGEPLPFDHGFPARLVIEGLYGYVSATKWLQEIELTRWEDFDGYWIPRGWSKEGPIKTQARIDVPARRDALEPGINPIAGVAWAPGRGVSKVEVRVDGGPWQEATISRPLSDGTWVQWMLPWEATSGVHVIQARATDGTGATQTEVERGVKPDGATGYPTRTVDVSSPA